MKNEQTTAERNRAWKATMDAEAGRVRAEDLRLDATNGFGEPLETDTGDRGDRVAIAEYVQAVRAASDHNPDVLARVKAGGRVNSEAEYAEVSRQIAEAVS